MSNILSLTEKDFATSEAYGKWLKKNKEALKARKIEVKIQNKGIDAIEDRDNKCETCGSKKQHPVTGYCFVCDTDNWKLDIF